MSPFHSGMNHWQRQWLSDRLHKKNEIPPPAENYNQVVSAKPKRPRKPKLTKPKSKPVE